MIRDRVWYIGVLLAAVLMMQTVDVGTAMAAEDGEKDQGLVIAVNMAEISRSDSGQGIRDFWNQQPLGSISYKTDGSGGQESGETESGQMPGENAQQPEQMPGSGEQQPELAEKTEQPSSPGTHEAGEVREFTDLKGKKKQYEMVFLGQHCTVWRATDSNAERNDGSNEDIPISDNLCRVYGTYYDETIFGAMQEAFGDWYRDDNSIFHVDLDSDNKTAIIFSDYGDEILGAMSLLDLVDEESGGNGNLIDCLWLNVNKATSPGYQDLMRSTMTHELQHLINTAYTAGNSETWLNETFSMSAEAMIDESSDTNRSYIRQIEDYLRNNKFSCPFIFQGRYVPTDGVEQTTVYGQWYAFGRYLSHQTEGYVGGGKQLFSQVLKNHSCTVPSLIKTLNDIGYLNDGGDWVTSFKQLVFNYNMAMYLNEESGIYSLGDTMISNYFSYPDEAVIDQASWSQLAIPGGGSMAIGDLDLNGEKLTIEGQGKDVLMSVFRVTEEAPGE